MQIQKRGTIHSSGSRLTSRPQWNERPLEEPGRVLPQSYVTDGGLLRQV